MVRIPLSFLFFFLVVAFTSFSQVSYTLIHRDSTSKKVKVIIQPSSAIRGDVNLVMPRSIPGGYQVYIYDKFLENIYAFNSQGDKLIMQKNESDAPRWQCSNTSSEIVRMEYEVNLDKMERQLVPGDASILREEFAGILNYSIFGWIDGTEKQPVQCTIETFDSWPIFTTLNPSATPKNGLLKFKADNYYSLADGQTFIGPRLRVKEYKALVPLFVASYSQTGDEYLDDYAKQEAISLEVLKDYFGEIPFPYYSIMLRKAIPLEPISAPALAMEHLQSSTFFGDTSRMRKAHMTEEEILRTLPTYLHHMGHAYIPLRCYGDSYKPYVMEIPPIIKNIWFNEGFMWFIPYDTLKSKRMESNFYNNVYKTSPIIKSLSLQQLSQTASTMYGTDFRLGLAVYSRGASMAIEMNDYIKEKTAGKKSMKDVLRYLYQWAKENKRPFTMEEFPQLINTASGVDLGEIYNRWQLPVK